MNNSAESIALPSFQVTLVTPKQDGDFQITETTLADFIAEKSQGLVLYFYPKDNTQGCSVQAMDFSEQLETLHQAGYQVIGVSRDGIKSHQNFITKKSLNIALISDADEKLCQHFGVIQEKMMYGKTHLGVVRSTFVFDAQGVMRASFRNVKAKEHVAKLLDFLQSS